MKIIPEPITFEWDKGNSEKNRTKHGVENRETEEAFVNKPFIVRKDITHSIKEQRYQALGKTKKRILLFLSFTIRMEKIRIISVRYMNKKERTIYEKIEKNTNI